MLIFFIVTIHFAIDTDLIGSLPFADVIVLESSAAPAVQPGAPYSARKYIRVSIHLVPVCRLRAARRGRAATVITRVTRHSVRSRTLPPPSSLPRKLPKEGLLSSPSILSAICNPIKPLAMCLTRPKSCGRPFRGTRLVHEANR